MNIDSRLTRRRLASTMLACGVMSFAATAQAAIETDDWAIYGQSTLVTQYHNKFKAPYEGTNSLPNQIEHPETFDLTAYIGRRLWQGAELWANPEIDQGFGVGNTFGVAGYPSGEAYKLGAHHPYFRLPRFFVRQTFNLGGEEREVAGAPNQFSGKLAEDSIVLTIGKFSIVDIFDTNTYAHDPRGDFLNWSIIDSGAFDYAGDAWGFTNGAAAEWNTGSWTFRAGYFALSRVPSSIKIDTAFKQTAMIGEVEKRYQWNDLPGKMKVLVYNNHGRMGAYNDAIALANQNATTPDASAVRKNASQPGYALNWEQAVSENAGVFARYSQNQGSKEIFDFTDINKSLAVGTSIHGNSWGRDDDVVGLAYVTNGLSNEAKNYFVAGGTGILIGDGNMNYAPEKIVEMYYAYRIDPKLSLTLDYQHIQNPAYNADRGPVSIVGARIHVDF